MPPSVTHQADRISASSAESVAAGMVGAVDHHQSNGILHDGDTIGHNGPNGKDEHINMGAEQPNGVGAGSSKMEGVVGATTSMTGDYGLDGVAIPSVVEKKGDHVSAHGPLVNGDTGHYHGEIGHIKLANDNPANNGAGSSDSIEHPQHPPSFAQKGDNITVALQPPTIKTSTETDNMLLDTSETFAPAAEHFSQPEPPKPAPITTPAPTAAAPQPPRKGPTHTLTWAVSTEQGYRNGPNAHREPIHPECEDVWAHKRVPPHPSSPPHAQTPSHIFILADGHGGISAARFFVSACEKELTHLLMSRPWDFSSDPDRRGFTTELSQAFQVMDAQYASRKVEEYRRWVDGGSRGGDKPVDDGCTLVVNVVHGGWIVNVNVGDSRTVIAMRKKVVVESGGGGVGVGADGEGVGEAVRRVDTGATGGSSSGSTTSGTTGSCSGGAVGVVTDSVPTTQFHPIFTSEDHNMLHPTKIYNIHRCGGQFVSPTGTLKTLTIHPPHLHPHPYTELSTSRIYRPPSPQVKAVGVSHRRTLNLTATMGDLLFKIEPAVMSCVPDVSFVEVVRGRDCVVVMGTDGVWDHLRWQGEGVVGRQGEAILEVLGGCLDLGGCGCGVCGGGSPDEGDGGEGGMNNYEVGDGAGGGGGDVPGIRVTDYSGAGTGGSVGSSCVMSKERSDVTSRLALATQIFVQREVPPLGSRTPRRKSVSSLSSKSSGSKLKLSTFLSRKKSKNGLKSPPSFDSTTSRESSPSSLDTESYSPSEAGKENSPVGMGGRCWRELGMSAEKGAASVVGVSPSVLFTPKQVRYDDATAVVVYLESL
ncbi:hypothetical protein HDV00_005836 [Rhizophlyctis rosea]|nr:hypothetical protein HDV00_005836 [Rhizophlyctis rosea]